MPKILEMWIRLKYQYYKLYWKIKKPVKPSKFYGWQEVGYKMLDQKAIAIGVIDEKISE